MKIHRLSLDETFDDNFHIIVIYSDEEVYRMAFLLNQHLGLQLKKADGIINKKNTTNFNVYEYENITLYRNWILLQNHCLTEKEVTNSHDLFSQGSSLFQQKNIYLKEFKKAQFILKIVTDKDNLFLENLIKRLQNISQIYAFELVDLAQLKNKKLVQF
jgi:hypothetical protein